ncbi:hypothetical protein [Mucilaginibacter sp.]|uniref:hypothetical protein n=1 Tax=Mucilaginibacter sp. TaxID=1882438 RepID=UPI003D14B530
MKKLKLPLTLLFILAAVSVQNSFAQKQTTGLYLTYNDYLHHKLSYTSDEPKGTKLVIHEFIGQKNVTIINNGKKKQLPKSELFGYHDANNNDYRFFDNKAYQIVDTTGFYIYGYDRLVQEGKGPKPLRTYYFSTKSNSSIMPLTPENIAVAFPKNQKFRNMIEVESKADIRLDAYDNVSAEYKIKEIYAESLK